MNKFNLFSSLEIQKRQETPFSLTLLTLVLSLLFGFLIIALIFWLSGFPTLPALGRIFSGSLGSGFGLRRTLAKSLPLIIVALGLSVAYQGKFWNIGAEGQLLMGATAATAISLWIGESLPGWLNIMMMVLAGAMAGALTAMIPAFMKTLGVNEVITTLMVNYLAATFVNFLIIGPMRGLNQGGYPRSDSIPQEAYWATLPGTSIPILSLILVLVLSVCVYALIFKSKKGLEIRILGENQEAARYAGIPYASTLILMMILSGGLAGIAGAGQIGSVHRHLTYPGSISGGYGFTAIIVAWLGRLHPLGIILSGFFFSLLIVGGEALKTDFGMPEASILVFNGVMLVCLICGTFFTQYRFIRKKEST